MEDGLEFYREPGKRSSGGRAGVLLPFGGVDPALTPPIGFDNWYLGPRASALGDSEFCRKDLACMQRRVGSAGRPRVRLESGIAGVLLPFGGVDPVLTLHLGRQLGNLGGAHDGGDSAEGGPPRVRLESGIAGVLPSFGGVDPVLTLHLGRQLGGVSWASAPAGDLELFGRVSPSRVGSKPGSAGLERRRGTRSSGGTPSGVEPQTGILWSVWVEAVSGGLIKGRYLLPIDLDSRRLGRGEPTPGTGLWPPSVHSDVAF